MDDEGKPSSFSTAGTEDPRFYEALGRAIKVLRAERGLSRRELAARSEVSYPYLSEIENGKKRPSSKALVAVATALGLRPSQLLETAESFVDVVSTPASTPVGERAAPAMVHDQEEAEPRSFLEWGDRVRGPSTSGRIARMSQGASSLPAAPEQARPGRSWFGGSVPEPASVDPDLLFDADLAEEPLSREALIERLRELANRLSDDDLERVLDLVERLLAP